MVTITKARNSEAQTIRRLEQKVWNEPNVTAPYDATTYVWHGYAFVAKDDGKL